MPSRRRLDTNKTLGKLSPDQLDRAHKAFNDLDRLGELSSLLGDKVRFRRLIESPRLGFNWAWAYEMPFATLTAAMLLRMGGTELLERVSASPDPQETLLKLNEGDELPAPDRLRTGDALMLAALLIALVRNIDCLGAYSVTLNQLVARAREGSEESFVSAIEIDPTVVCGPTGTHLFAKCVALGNTKLLRRVQKALSGPHKGRRIYRDLRTVGVMLDEAGAFDSASSDHIHAVVVDQLGLYEQRSGDSHKGLRTLLKRWQEDAART